MINEVAGTGGDPSLSTALAAVDNCHQETVLLEEVVGQLEGQMAQLGARVFFLCVPTFSRAENISRFGCCARFLFYQQYGSSPADIYLHTRMYDIYMCVSDMCSIFL